MELFLNKEEYNYYTQDLFAKAAVSVLFDLINTEERDIFKKLFDTKKQLLEKNQNNIVMKNAITFFLSGLPSSKIKEAAKEKYHETIKKINNANKETEKNGAKKIVDGATVFVHSVNNNIRGLLLEASKTKNFSVNLLEHRLRALGNTLSQTLNKQKITTNVFSDISLKDAVFSSDICFIGCEALIKGKGAIAKTGSTLVAEISKKHNIPTYMCLPSLKYDHENFFNHSSYHPIKNVTDPIGKQYDEISDRLINGYVCEHGIFNQQNLLREIKFYSGWLFM